MKRIVTITLLLIAIGVLIWQQQKNTLEAGSTDFSTVNMNEIEQIYFADRYGNEVSLNNIGKDWLVNNKYFARTEALETLFSTLEKMKIKHPVSESMHNSVIKTLASEGVKVELYTNQETLLKTFYIGSETADFLGTYMMMENANKAYVMHIPGFNGFLTPRFNIDGRKIKSELWRDRQIFQNTSIDSIQIQYHETPNRNFSLTSQCNILYGNKQQKTIDSTSCANYFQLFKKLNCEGFSNDLAKKDSLLGSPPFHTLRVYYSNGNIKKLETYHKKPKRKEYQNEDGTPLKYDINRLYAFDGEDLLLIQNYTFNPILKPKFTVEK